MEKKLTESIEDYIETIYLDFLKDNRGVRITDLAQAMGVSKASANDAVKKLKTLGYVDHERYGQIYLTDNGEAMGIKIYEKHCIIKEFLTDILEVTSQIAEEDACCIEHVISEETFEKMKHYLNKE
ncbi:MAG: metal-dependent transcriptional regulator [Eubacterium sp.]